MNLKAEQHRLYGLLPDNVRCFVRVCDDDSALWVSDLPRLMPECKELADLLRKAGFEARLDESARLWYVDWTEERWQEMLDGLPTKWPRLPAQDCYHEAYALCRLWLLHPAGRTPENLPMVRRVLKLTAAPRQKLLRSVRALHGEAAAQLRTGATSAYDAGRVLAEWLNEHAFGKEREP